MRMLPATAGELNILPNVSSAAPPIVGRFARRRIKSGLAAQGQRVNQSPGQSKKGGRFR
jgi:hypothetical protein